MHTVPDAFPSCRNRAEKVACVGAAMLRLQPEATRENIKAVLGINDRELDAVVDDARAYAAANSVRHTRQRVPASHAA